MGKGDAGERKGPNHMRVPNWGACYDDWVQEKMRTSGCIYLRI